MYYKYESLLDFILDYIRVPRERTPGSARKLVTDKVGNSKSWAIVLVYDVPKGLEDVKKARRRCKAYSIQTCGNVLSFRLVAFYITEGALLIITLSIKQ